MPANLFKKLSQYLIIYKNVTEQSELVQLINRKINDIKSIEKKDLLEKLCEANAKTAEELASDLSAKGAALFINQNDLKVLSEHHYSMGISHCDLRRLALIFGKTELYRPAFTTTIAEAEKLEELRLAAFCGHINIVEFLTRDAQVKAKLNETLLNEELIQKIVDNKQIRTLEYLQKLTPEAFKTLENRLYSEINVQDMQNKANELNNLKVSAQIAKLSTQLIEMQNKGESSSILATVAQATTQFLNKEINAEEYQQIAYQVQGHPSGYMAILANMMAGLAGIMLAAGIVLSIFTAGAGIGLIAGGVALAVGGGATLFFGNRPTGLSKEINDLAKVVMEEKSLDIKL